MLTHCPSCGEAFREGDKAQQLPPILELRRGEKSGTLGWYQVPNGQTDVPHIECVQGFYQIESTEAWDEIDRNLRERVREEERDAIRDETLQEKAVMCCMECLENMSRDEVQDMFMQLADEVLNDPDTYLEQLTYEQGYRLWQAFGHALSIKAQKGQS